MNTLYHQYLVLQCQSFLNLVLACWHIVQLNKRKLQYNINLHTHYEVQNLLTFTYTVSDNYAL